MLLAEGGVSDLLPALFDFTLLRLNLCFVFGVPLIDARRKGRSSLGGARVTYFVEVLFPRFAELQTSARHPKWREVNLAASLPGFSRTPAADTWLNERTAETGAKPIAAGPGAVQPASMPDGAMSNGDKEALFQRAH